MTHKLNIMLVEKTEKQRLFEDYSKNDFWKNNPSPVGWWVVTTEGDCEGRTTRNLGTHWGHVAEIAFQLADKSMYGLCFEPVTDKEEPKAIGKVITETIRKSVHISIDIKSGTWDMTRENRAKWFQYFLDTDDVKVKPSTYFASVVLELP